MSNLRVPAKMIPDNPVLLDRALWEISDNLATELSWIDNNYGLAQRVDDANQGLIPAYYTTGGIEYFPLFPDESLGNFLFFDRDETRSIFDNPEKLRSGANVKEKIGLIVWYNIKTVFPTNWRTRTNENVKGLVLQALEDIVHIHSSYTAVDMFHEGKNIYKGYKLPESRSQYLMRPFGGFRINLNISYNNLNRC